MIGTLFFRFFLGLKVRDCKVNITNIESNFSSNFAGTFKNIADAETGANLQNKIGHFLADTQNIPKFS